MANLNDISMEATAQSAIVYGPPKSGKTELVVKSLATKFKVLFVDLEKGRTTLMKLPPALKKNVEVIAVQDFKDSPSAIQTALHLASGKATRICEKHGKVKCTDCLTKRGKVETYNLSTLDPAEWVVVFDSFTQLTSSANGHVTKGLNSDLMGVGTEEFKHWRAQGTLLERFLDYLQNAPYNVVLITHEMGIEQVDGTEKIQPSGGTKNFARNVPKYFDHVIYTSVKNRKHKAISATTSENMILSGSRTDTVVDVDDPDSVCALFGK